MIFYDNPTQPLSEHSRPVHYNIPKSELTMFKSKAGFSGGGGFKGGMSRVTSLTVVWGCWMWLVKLVATPQVLRMIGFKRFKSVQIFMKHQDARNILFFWWSACWRNISNSIFTAGTWHTNSTKAWDLPYLLYTCYM